MKRSMTIQGLAIEVTNQYKSWMFARDGGYQWGVTELATGRTVGGWAATEDEAKAITANPAAALAAQQRDM